MALSQTTLIQSDQQSAAVKQRDPWIAKRLLPEERATIVARYVAGESFDALHDELGFSVAFLRKMVRQAGQQTRGNAPGWNAWRKIELPEDKIAAAYVAGDSLEKLAKVHCVSSVTISRLLRRKKIATRRRHYLQPFNPTKSWKTRRMPAEQRGEIVARYLAGNNFEQVHQQFDVSPGFVRDIVIAAGHSPRERHAPTDDERRASQIAKSIRWQERHPDKLRAWQQSSEGKACNERKSTKYKATPRGRAVVLVKLAQNRARRYGFLFALTIEDILPALERGVCQATGMALQFGTHRFRGGPGPYTASIDRIIPALGYVPGNVQIVCWVYNTAKRHFPPSVVLRMARALVKQDRLRRRSSSGASEAAPPDESLFAITEP